LGLATTPPWLTRQHWDALNGLTNYCRASQQASLAGHDPVSMGLGLAAIKKEKLKGNYIYRYIIIIILTSLTFHVHGSNRSLETSSARAARVARACNQGARSALDTQLPDA